MSEQIKDFIAAVNGPTGCLDGWLESASESEVREAIRAVMQKGALPSGDMTLRDYFAAKAVQGELAGQTEGRFYEFNAHNMKSLAVFGYAMADAMLAAREVTP
jgi:hypothetical protein